jgi:hypothetical protein
MRNVAVRQLKNNRPINATAKTSPPAKSVMNVARFMSNSEAPVAWP